MENIRINGKIEIITEDGFVSEGMVMDIGEDWLVFSVPADDRRFRLYNPEEELELRTFHGEKGLRFFGTVGQRIIEEGPSFELVNLRGFETIQRRAFVRVLTSALLPYIADQAVVEAIGKTQSTPEEIEKYTQEFREGYLVDLSGGGLRLSTIDDFPEGQRMACLLSMEETALLICGTVVNKQIIPSAKSTRYFYGVRFDGVEEAEQDRIVRYVFELMRRQMKR